MNVLGMSNWIQYSMTSTWKAVHRNKRQLYTDQEVELLFPAAIMFLWFLIS